MRKIITALVLATLVFFGVISCGTKIPEGSATPKTSVSTKSDAKPTKKTEHYTVSQKNAIRAANNYINSSGFSKAGLIKQLSSEYGDGFTKTDAEFAVSHIKVDWNKEAVESAKQYMDMTGFSRKGLISQLSSPYGSQYTLEQATQAADKVGL